MVATFGSIISAFSIRKYSAKSPVDLLGPGQFVFVWDVIIPCSVWIPIFGQIRSCTELPCAQFRLSIEHPLAVFCERSGTSADAARRGTAAQQHLLLSGLLTTPSTPHGASCSMTPLRKRAAEKKFPPNNFFWVEASKAGCDIFN